MTILTKDAVDLFDTASGQLWEQMSRRQAEGQITMSRELGDTFQEYATTDRDGNPLTVLLQDMPSPFDGGPNGPVYVLPA